MWNTVQNVGIVDLGVNCEFKFPNINSILTEMLTAYQQMLVSENLGNQECWTVSNHPTAKYGSSTYHTIDIISCVSIVLLKIIQHWLIPIIKRKLRVVQAGFIVPAIWQMCNRSWKNSTSVGNTSACASLTTWKSCKNLWRHMTEKLSKYRKALYWYDNKKQIGLFHSVPILIHGCKS